MDTRTQPQIGKAAETITADYVIVGAGSAGCVLANRLTEDPRTRVMLIEAGPRDTNIWIHVPLGYGKLFTKSEVNWGYESDPEPTLGGRRIFTPRGKVLGGSSSIPAGTGSPCCRISASRRTRNAARTSGTAPAGRSR
jgi:choline dehydrogenase